jgi:HK97 family phage prohead protease
MNGTVEIREVQPGGPLEDRAVELSVYPSLTGIRYQVGPDWDEEVERGAFRRTLANVPPPDVILRLEHAGLGLAGTRPVDGAPTLQLSEDERGLHARAQLAAADPDAQMLKVKARQAPLETSFAFKVTRQTWSKDYTHRILHEVDLHRGDVAITGRGASPATQGTVSLRGAGGLEQRKRRAELLGQRFTGSSFTYAEPTDSGLIVTRAARPVRSHIEQSKLDLAQALGRRDLPGSDASVGRRALNDLVLSPFGEDWEIVSATDVHRAVLAVEVGHAKGADEGRIKAWVFKRADDLGVPQVVPPGWKGDWR